MAWGVWKLICDICGADCVSVIYCDDDGDWPIQDAGAECPRCENMSMYPQETNEEVV